MQPAIHEPARGGTVRAKERVMNVTLVDEGQKCRFILEGRLTFESAPELRGRIIDASRRFSRFEVDLSGVSEIDLCGVHVLRMLRGTDGEEAVLVADSPVAEEVRALMASGRCASRQACPWKAVAVAAA